MGAGHRGPLHVAIPESLRDVVDRVGLHLSSEICIDESHPVLQVGRKRAQVITFVIMDRPGKIGCVSSARRTYIDGRTIVGVPSGFISAGDGGHTDARLVSGRISGLSAVFITCREYHDAARHRPGLGFAVGGHTRVADEVVDSFFSGPIRA